VFQPRKCPLFMNCCRIDFVLDLSNQFLPLHQWMVIKKKMYLIFTLWTEGTSKGLGDREEKSFVGPLVGFKFLWYLHKINLKVICHTLQTYLSLLVFKLFWNFCVLLFSSSPHF
jgi:hypothetical protein